MQCARREKFFQRLGEPVSALLIRLNERYGLNGFREITAGYSFYDPGDFGFKCFHFVEAITRAMYCECNVTRIGVLASQRGKRPSRKVTNLCIVELPQWFHPNKLDAGYRQISAGLYLN